jgi:transcription initiation factor IIE alpha subunit
MVVKRGLELRGEKTDETDDNIMKIFGTKKQEINMQLKMLYNNEISDRTSDILRVV